MGASTPVTLFPAVGGSRLPGQLVFYAVGFAVNCGIAYVSLRWFEGAFLRLKRHFEYPSPTRPAHEVAPVGPARSPFI